jgi:hypothetical protein
MVFREDYLLAGIRRLEPRPGPIYRDEGISIVVPSESPFDMEVYMNLTPQASGVVVDAQGHPVEGIGVSAFRLGYDSSGERILIRMSRLGSSSTTDDRGEFAINTVPPGDYVFGVGSEFSRKTVVPTYYPSEAELSRAEVVRLRPGDDIRLRPVVLQNVPLLWLDVKVFDENGDEVGVPRVSVRRVGEEQGLTFGALGSRLMRLPAGFYTVEAAEFRSDETPAGIRPVKFARAAVEIRDADTTLRVVVTEGSTATVRILHDNGSALKPAPGVPVRLIPRGFGSTLLRPFTGTSGADGTFTAVNVPAGTYRVSLPLHSETGDRDLPNEDPVGSDLQNVCVRDIRQSDTAITGDEIRIGNTNSTVTVTLSDSTTRIQGHLGVPGGSAVVALVPDDRKQIQRYVATNADPDGNFQFKCALPGEYRLYAWTDLTGAPYRNEAFMANYRDQGTPVRVTEGGTLTVQTPLIQP